MGQSVAFHDRVIGEGQPPYVISEIGANHNGDLHLAKRLIDAAEACGADAAKFQSWSETSLISEAEYERNTSYSDGHRHFGSLREMVREYQLSEEDQNELAAYCRSRGLHYLSSAFSPHDIEMLDNLDVPAIKIASMDINHLPLLEAAASVDRPVILSTGMAHLSEIDEAVTFMRDRGLGELILLHCVSLYPAPPESLNLRNIPMLKRAFSCPIGFSDHSAGCAAAFGAVALGAAVVEKHFTLDKELPGWDHAISAEPHELERICQGVTKVAAALGSSQRQVNEAEFEKRKSFRRSIVVRGPLAAGSELTPDDLDFKRPGTGISPAEARYVVGRCLARDVSWDHELDWTDLL